MITVAKYKHKYFKAICKLTDHEWDMGKTMAKTKNLLPTKFYYYLAFRDHPVYHYVLLDNGECIGYIALADCRKKNSIFKRAWYNFLMWFTTIRMKSPSGFKKFWSYYDFIPPVGSFDCDCELKHWIVHEAYRKNHNGKHLWTVAMAQARNLGLRNMIIYTDNTSSYWVYDMMGATRELERDVDFTADGYRVNDPEHAIMFKYKIK